MALLCLSARVYLQVRFVTVCACIYRPAVARSLEQLTRPLRACLGGQVANMFMIHHSRIPIVKIKLRNGVAVDIR